MLKTVVILLCMLIPYSSLAKSTGDPTEAKKYQYITFDTAHHPKAKGVSFTIDYPNSWKAEEANGSSIVQKFTGEDDYVQMLISIKKIPLASGQQITEQEQHRILYHIHTALPENAKYIDAQMTKLDDIPIRIIEFTEYRERSGIELYNHFWNVHFVYDQATVTVAFVVSASRGKEEYADHKIANLKPLFWHTLNSITFDSQYRDSGQHLGKFDTTENATAYAEQLHQQQANQYVPIGDNIVSAREQPGLALQQGDTPVQSLLKFNEIYPDAIKRIQAIPNIDERNATIEELEKRRLLAQSAATAWKTKFKNDAQNLGINPDFTSVDQIPPDMLSALSDEPATMIYLQQRAAYNLENSASGGAIRDVKNYGPKFYEVYAKILDGKITSAEEINAALVNKEITLAGHDKAMAAIKTTLRNERASQSSPEDKSRRPWWVDAFHALGKSYIVVLSAIVGLWIFYRITGVDLSGEFTQQSKMYWWRRPKK